MKETHTTPAPVTDNELTAFCAVIAEKKAAYFAKHLSNLTPPRIYADKGGRKWIRIVTEDLDGSNRSVVCFVERSTGLVWKAAGWKAPARNFPRGDIRGDNRFAKTDNIYGVLYA